MVTKNLLNSYLRDNLVPAGAAASLISYSLLMFLENQNTAYGRVYYTNNLTEMGHFS